MTPTKKAIERVKTAKAEKRKKILRTFVAVIGAIGTLLGIGTSLLALASRISMSSDSPINPSDIMSTPFVVSNDGPLDIHDVGYGCVDRKILSDTGLTIAAPGPYTKWLGGFSTPQMVADVIPPTGKQAFTCPMSALIPSGHVTYGDIIIAVSYRPAWWPYKWQKLHRFATALDANRKPVRWYEQPMPKE